MGRKGAAEWLPRGKATFLKEGNPEVEVPVSKINNLGQSGLFVLQQEAKKHSNEKRGVASRSLKDFR